MNNQAPNQKWETHMSRLKLMFPFLTDEDFIFDYGMRDVMLNKLQSKLGKNREELNQLLVTFEE